MVACRLDIDWSSDVHWPVGQRSIGPARRAHQLSSPSASSVRSLPQMNHNLDSQTCVHNQLSVLVRDPNTHPDHKTSETQQYSIKRQNIHLMPPPPALTTAIMVAPSPVQVLLTPAPHPTPSPHPHTTPHYQSSPLHHTPLPVLTPTPNPTPSPHPCITPHSQSSPLHHTPLRPHPRTTPHSQSSPPHCTIVIIYYNYFNINWQLFKLIFVKAR